MHESRRSDRGGDLGGKEKSKKKNGYRKENVEVAGEPKNAQPEAGQMRKGDTEAMKRTNRVPKQAINSGASRRQEENAATQHESSVNK